MPSLIHTVTLRDGSTVTRTSKTREYTCYSVAIATQDVIDRNREKRDELHETRERLRQRVSELAATLGITVEQAEAVHTDLYETLRSEGQPYAVPAFMPLLYAARELADTTYKLEHGHTPQLGAELVIGWHGTLRAAQQSPDRRRWQSLGYTVEIRHDIEKRRTQARVRKAG